MKTYVLLIFQTQIYINININVNVNININARLQRESYKFILRSFLFYYFQSMFFCTFLHLLFKKNQLLEIYYHIVILTFFSIDAKVYAQNSCKHNCLCIEPVTPQLYYNGSRQLCPEEKSFVNACSYVCFRNVPNPRFMCWEAITCCGERWPQSIKFQNAVKCAA